MDEFDVLRIILILLATAIFGIAIVCTLSLNEDNANYKIDGTNIICDDGITAFCGYSLTDCSDGQDRECVTNIIKVKK